eukprot:UN34220
MTFIIFVIVLIYFAYWTYFVSKFLYSNARAINSESIFSTGIGEDSFPFGDGATLEDFDRERAEVIKKIIKKARIPNGLTSVCCTFNQKPNRLLAPSDSGWSPIAEDETQSRTQTIEIVEIDSTLPFLDLENRLAVEALTFVTPTGISEVPSLLQTNENDTEVGVDSDGGIDGEEENIPNTEWAQITLDMNLADTPKTDDPKKRSI